MDDEPGRTIAQGGAKRNPGYECTSPTSHVRAAGNTRGLVSAFNNDRRCLVERLPIFLPPLQGLTLFSAYLGFRLTAPP